MSSQARTQRVHRMQVDMSWRIIGSPGRSSPERSGRSRPSTAVGTTSYWTRYRSNSLRGLPLRAGYRSARSRRTPLRFSTAACDWVVTTMPSATLVAHAGISFAWPSTETRQMRQLPTIGRVGYQQRVGISMPAFRAASRIVWPSDALRERPSTLRLGMPDKYAAESEWQGCYRVVLLDLGVHR